MRNPSDNPSNRDIEITALQNKMSVLEQELSDQRRENAKLKQKINHLKGNYGVSTDISLREMRRSKKADPVLRERQDLFYAETVNARRFSKRNYALFLIQTLKESTLGLVIRRISRFFRRWRLFRNIAMITGAVFVTLLLSAFFLTALPFLLLLLLVSLLAIFFRAKSANRRMRGALENTTRVRIIIFPDSTTFRESSFAQRSAMAMSEEKGTAIIAVTPRLWSTTGLGGKGMFFTAREEKPQLFLVRRGYYFILNRSVLHELSLDVTVMYG